MSSFLHSMSDATWSVPLWLYAAPGIPQSAKPSAAPTRSPYPGLGLRRVTRKHERTASPMKLFHGK
jgi:hypothetical protein